ncbi:MAG: translation initiation factor IF-2 [Candidatus Staskawiczbacteria bacterium RIFCSPHIGHO2_02_FULL_43_16]|uniref:Translation initiation factor IF-2 n=1 Tax=Candidatus Staskawiczbacteria bacterium RIFCSPHIGHO2_01_FULL_41_41 TaxID=1802203 RepID=A0A1G2HVH4_9BACT|nr:MAG: translation initiation factor IF-2 [Candidatus Staskawiczbacteria bacterium RIFCSPHIGHO2_01_FULL_41_41]OGZ68898.1 MAG: translation initiation factor IF-2 [Candidatus Staskawiczbacteria bacterium RIFCSPHIGHO2_02_FULL_43_16]OGZ74920.1 MAG: translation initiation factor IF-2 [Candidatus Staskawiczbacteria bacterium RIFCSPLOWO2_01_FULL_43_17b]
MIKKKTASAVKPKKTKAQVIPETPKKPIEPVIKRPPVVVVLGHVDHGKSSLLEAIRDFKITAKESGGITQHIGAYEVEQHGKHITFIDTPGHEAFSAMRTRGASVADIALLVVDAAQSVQPQTKEAISAIKNAGIPMIAVLNKIDLPSANPRKIKEELSRADVFVESLGGTVPCVEVSAKEKTGIDELLEIILLVADLQDLTADIKSPAEALVIESYMDSLKGPVATVIVQKGILLAKDIVATQTAMAKIKLLQDFQGKTVEKVMPGSPTIILGFEKVPGVGEVLKSYPSMEAAGAAIKTHGDKKEINYGGAAEGDGSRKTANIILKGDVFGSLEAIDGMLKTLPSDQVTLRVIKAEVGDINESDAKLAETTGAHIIGFRVKINPGVLALMRNDTQKRVRIKTFDIIYELIQEVRNGMEKSLDAENVRKEVGKLKTILVFWAEKNRQIVGGKITEGELKKGLKLDVVRADVKVGAGRIVNLQRDKKDIDLLKKGDEAGILFEGNIKIEQGDILVAYVEERQKGIL